MMLSEGDAGFGAWSGRRAAGSWHRRQRTADLQADQQLMPCEVRRQGARLVYHLVYPEPPWSASRVFAYVSSSAPPGTPGRHRGHLGGLRFTLGRRKRPPRGERAGTDHVIGRSDFLDDLGRGPSAGDAQPRDTQADQGRSGSGRMRPGAIASPAGLDRSSRSRAVLRAPAEAQGVHGRPRGALGRRCPEGAP